MSNPTDGRTRESRFVALYEATYDDLVRFAQRRLPEPQAEDVVGEALLVAWRRLDDVPPQLPDARAWLFGIVRNTILNSRRGVRRQEALAVRLAEVTTTWSPDDAELIARQVDLTRAWGRLSALHQEALALAVIDDLSARQAASVLGITAVAFRLRLSRARHALRAQLGHRATPATAPAGLTERPTS
ncbi:RNA polymerase sigma factor [Kribbella sandramycini]|uniref:RNA polymerase sigma factor n=1 Tax=Kribbella sandramycini TaxID=60450 RepID=A0A7Y4KX86_9ACTN|nr:RNA polymerase sigma factor [Kribbella sandramycini]MBB6569890.1 RNA polymerase sigma-70 factor (ECF subfamily) [Kribbella sandramycini]NOL40285.1 RNA polymerase sigma factor [Kribbella sandramycini]